MSAARTEAGNAIFAGAFSLHERTVAEAMHLGVVTCPIDTPLLDVARMMAGHRVHCIVVFDGEDGFAGENSLWGVVSDLDLVAGMTVGRFADRTAGTVAGSPLVTVRAGETLMRAAQLMVEHQSAHLVVVSPETGVPVGVLSTLDLARIASDDESTEGGR